MLPPTNPNALPPGTQLQDGQFILGEVLGEGGFGITYQAHDSVLNRTVAIKEFFPPGSTRRGINAIPSGMDDSAFTTAREAFIEEARTLARFSHPNIVSVYAVFPANNTAYMVMEFVRGQSLQQIVEVLGAFPVEEAMAVMLPACAALKVIHDAGLLHGDIKPANIMRAGDGRIVLLDFGLTRRIEPNRYATILLTPARYGTAGYAPLEQYGRQAEMGPFSDIYALAATLYFLLLADTPPAATDRATGIALDSQLYATGQLAHAVATGMAMQPNERPQSVDEFVGLLQNAMLVVPPTYDTANAAVADAPQYDAQIIRQGDDGSWNSAASATTTAEPDDAVWESETIYGSNSPQSTSPGWRSTSSRGQRGPGNWQRYDTPNGTVVTSGGCTGCCACGCLALLAVMAFVGTAVGSVLEFLLRLVGG